MVRELTVLIVSSSRGDANLDYVHFSGVSYDVLRNLQGIKGLSTESENRQDRSTLARAL